MWVVLVFPFLFIVSGLFATTTVIHFPREDGSIAEGYLNAPENQESFPVVVFVDGSHEASVSISHEKLAPRFNPNQIGLLSLEKRGISSEGVDREEYLQHDCFEERLQDYILLLRA